MALFSILSFRSFLVYWFRSILCPTEVGMCSTPSHWFSCWSRTAWLSFLLLSYLVIAFSWFRFSSKKHPFLWVLSNLIKKNFKIRLYWETYESILADFTNLNYAHMGQKGKIHYPIWVFSLISASCLMPQLMINTFVKEITLIYHNY